MRPPSDPSVEPEVRPDPEESGPSVAARSLCLASLQHRHAEWSRANFGAQPPVNCLLGALEELGELAHAHLKAEQGIRGSESKHAADAQDAVADVVLYLIDYCSRRGWNFDAILLVTAEQVHKRDWNANPETGAES